MTNESSNIVWSHSDVTRDEREKALKQKGRIIWFTGLSGSGKSTLAKALEQRLFERGNVAYILDGDNIRTRLSSDLGFSDEDRTENMRRIGEVAILFADAGLITIAAFISPFRSYRDRVREVMDQDCFIEIYLDVPLKVCEARDPKGLYKKARAGEIEKFTGISSPYEEPVKPELALNTAKMPVEECIDLIEAYLCNRQLL